MRRSWIRYQKWCVVLSSGGVTLGILQGFSLINWASFITQLLIALVTMLLGGQSTQV